MTTVNPQLQARAGRNIGIEPTTGLAFVQDAGAPETDVNPTGDTVILECPEGMARAPIGSREAFQGSSGLASGFIVNRTASPYGYDVIFRDDQGNEITIQSGTADANAMTPFVYAPWGGAGKPETFVLNPGEKILLRQGGVQ